MVPGIGIAGDFIGAVLIANKPHNLYGGLMGWPFEKVGQLRLILVLFFLVEGGARLCLLSNTGVSSPGAGPGWP